MKSCLLCLKTIKTFPFLGPNLICLIVTVAQIIDKNQHISCAVWLKLKIKMMHLYQYWLKLIVFHSKNTLISCILTHSDYSNDVTGLTTCVCVVAVTQTWPSLHVRTHDKSRTWQPDTDPTATWIRVADNSAASGAVKAQIATHHSHINLDSHSDSITWSSHLRVGLQGGRSPARI